MSFESLPGVLEDIEVPPHFIHGKSWCIQKNPIFTHFLNKHFLGHPVHIRVEYIKESQFDLIRQITIKHKPNIEL